MATMDWFKGELSVGIQRNTTNRGRGAFTLNLSHRGKQVSCVRLRFGEALRLCDTLTDEFRKQLNKSSG